MTYNRLQHTVQCLCSIVMQKVTRDVEITLADDFLTDH